MGSPISPKYPLFLRDIGKGGSGFSTIEVENNFNIDAKPGVFYDIRNKENDEININLEDNNNNQFLINCPCTLSFNKDINWVELDEPNLLVPIKILITVINNIANYKYIIDGNGDNSKIIIYKFTKNSDIIPTHHKEFNNFGIIYNINLDSDEYIFEDIIRYYNSIGGDSNDIYELILPKSLITISYTMVYNLKVLRKINIPDSVKYIESNAFTHCDYLTYTDGYAKYVNNWLVFQYSSIPQYTIINIKEGTVGVAMNAFNNNSATHVSKIICPKSLKYINDFAFYGCDNLMENVILNEGLLEIGNYAFNTQSGITLPNSIEYLGENNNINVEMSGKPFTNDSHSGYYIGKILYYLLDCFKETLIIKEGTTQIYNNVTSGFMGTVTPKTIILPNTLRYIGKYAFAELTLLEHITIPDSVEYIAPNAFILCQNLKTITTAKGTYDVGEYDVVIELANGNFVMLYIDEEMYECVLPETEILINNQGDTKQIKDLQIGDTVITNKNNNIIETTINKLVQVQHNNYLKVTLENNDILNISLDHNICTKDGWKCYNNTISKNKECVGKLTIGDEVLTTNGLVKIISIEMINKENTIMYNIGVKEGNNYYANGICVYECDK